MFALKSAFLVLAISLTLSRGASVASVYKCWDGSVPSELKTSASGVTSYRCPASAGPEPDFNKTNGHTFTFNKDYSTSLTTRTTEIDTCGGECTTYCYTPAGGGPNPNDCSDLATLIEGEADDFTVPPGYTQSWSLYSCKATITNWDGTQGVQYCLSQVADIINYLAFNCQAQQNANGGQCDFFNDDPLTGAVVVQHS